MRVFQLIPQLSNGLFKHGMPGLGSNLSQGNQHKSPFMHSWVWDLENGSVKDLFSIQEDVQVYGARGSGWPGVWTAQTGLDLPTSGQQILGI